MANAHGGTMQAVCVVSRQALRQREKGNENGEHLEDKTLTGMESKKDTRQIHGKTDTWKD